MAQQRLFAIIAALCAALAIVAVCYGLETKRNLDWCYIREMGSAMP